MSNDGVDRDYDEGREMDRWMAKNPSKCTELLCSMTETALHLAESNAAGVPRGDALRAMSKVSRPKLTAAQRRRVRELVEDGGYSRKEAVAWVQWWAETEPEVCR